MSEQQERVVEKVEDRMPVSPWYSWLLLLVFGDTTRRVRLVMRLVRFLRVSSAQSQIMTVNRFTSQTSVRTAYALWEDSNDPTWVAIPEPLGSFAMEYASKHGMPVAVGAEEDDDEDEDDAGVSLPH